MQSCMNVVKFYLHCQIGQLFDFKISKDSPSSCSVPTPRCRLLLSDVARERHQVRGYRKLSQFQDSPKLQQWEKYWLSC